MTSADYRDPDLPVCVICADTGLYVSERTGTLVRCEDCDNDPWNTTTEQWDDTVRGSDG